MRIALFGYGYVGKAVAHFFTGSPIELYINDPKYFDYRDHSSCKGAIICVDTPMNDDGTFDTSQLYAVLRDLRGHEDFPVLFKSTTPPSVLTEIEDEFPNLRISFSPEYLSSRTNIQDFMDQKFMIIGSNHLSATRFFKNMFMKVNDRIEFHETDLITASLVKYAENCFLATKVTFFNLMHRAHEGSGAKSSYSEFAKLVSLDTRINDSHTEVPGWDGQKGWGGHCFTKDTLAFYEYCNKNGIDGDFMLDVIDQNDKDRC